MNIILSLCEILIFISIQTFIPNTYKKMFYINLQILKLYFCSLMMKLKSIIIKLTRC